ncbi:serine/threonine-protein kinase, partial [Micromonospora echinofusca]
MGRVWLARDEVLHREVAVKQISLPPWAGDDERDRLIARTMREAQAAARLNHPNVVAVHDVVYVDGTPWIVMEYVPSRSLQDVLDTGPVTPRRAAQIGLALLAALRAAHQAGVLHRDVKPGNVLLADDGRVMLTDFGLATFDDSRGVLTRPGMVMGSPEYVAPERAREGVSSVGTDLWSLGATLYAAVEGRSPYARPTPMATLTALATTPPDPPTRAGILDPVLAGLLQRDPGRRVGPDAAERLLRTAAGLDPYRPGEQPATGEMPGPAGPVPSVPTWEQPTTPGPPVGPAPGT